ncbi:DUF6000 family protein [Chryseobacterium sp. Hurlbut01]|jgi:hypothetical protein|uniref:DUF6000 family protein n=1 Tax=Chryseobacterium sp. Hurlbut01 TaxID=1681828 RepID=UPI00067B825A|nr:DUF6000 family protein [Chryseobacterium sp. Hurlbut01]KNB62248.1 hypothetical protein AC804_05115 [Chryseobacterium sp. Hurlbut01]
MNEDLKKQMELHSVGAIVRHESPFEKLISHRNKSELNSDFIEKWVLPFYMSIGHYYDDSWIDNVINISKEITEEITLKLLGDFNWRSRLVGTYFSAVKNFQGQIDIIGIHFLKSELCCVGHIYSLVLAFYNNEKTNDYLNSYLKYYLAKPELYFDQESVLESIVYLDKINGTNFYQQHHKEWKKLNIQRNKIEVDNTFNISKIIEKEQGKESAKQYLNTITSNKNIKNKDINIDYITKQIEIVRNLQSVCS